MPGWLAKTKTRNVFICLFVRQKRKLVHPSNFNKGIKYISKTCMKRIVVVVVKSCRKLQKVLPCVFKHNKADVSLTAFSDDFITNLGYVFSEAIFGETSKHGASFAIIKREQYWIDKGFT